MSEQDIVRCAYLARDSPPMVRRGKRMRSARQLQLVHAAVALLAAEPRRRYGGYRGSDDL